MSDAMPAVPGAAPSRLRYLVAVVIFFAGMAGMGIFLVNQLSEMQDELTRFVVPGERTLAFEAGKYTVFHETESIIDGKVYSSPGLGGLTVTVTGPGGETVALTPAGSGHYTFGGHKGTSLFDFEATGAGEYTVAGQYAPGASGPETVLAVGAGFMSSLLGTIFGALGIAFAGSIIAAILVVMTLVKRRRAGFKF